MKGVALGDDLPTASYPIEVGFAHANGYSDATLIRPQKGWTDWQCDPDDPDIGLIHNISRQSLFDEGADVADVANWLNEELAGKIIMCDSPQTAADSFWLKRLFNATDIEQSFELHYIYDYLDLDDKDAIHQAHENARLPSAPDHRAEQDAKDLMAFYQAYYALKNGPDHHRAHDAFDM